MNRLLRFAAIAAVFAALGGCVVAPAPYQPTYAYGYPPYAYAPAPVYYPPTVSLGFGFGECFNCGRWHHWR